MLQFSEFVWPLSYSVWDVFNNFLLIGATDRSKIGSDKKRFFIALGLYPLSFFANTPFNDLKQVCDLLTRQEKVCNITGMTLWPHWSSSFDCTFKHDESKFIQL